MGHMGLIEHGVPQKNILFYRHFPHWHSHKLLYMGVFIDRGRIARLWDPEGAVGPRKNHGFNGFITEVLYIYPLVMTNIAMVQYRWPIEIDGLAVNSMVIFHGYVTNNQRVYIYILYVPWWYFMIFLYFWWFYNYFHVTVQRLDGLSGHPISRWVHGFWFSWDDHSGHGRPLPTSIPSTLLGIPSGKHTKSYWTWPIEIVDLPINSMVIFNSYVTNNQRVL